jgi:hypothetical protein
LTKLFEPKLFSKHQKEGLEMSNKPLAKGISDDAQEPKGKWVGKDDFKKRKVCFLSLSLFHSNIIDNRNWMRLVKLEMPLQKWIASLDATSTRTSLSKKNTFSLFLFASSLLTAKQVHLENPMVLSS